MRRFLSSIDARRASAPRDFSSHSSNIDSIFKSFQQVDLSPTRKYDGTGLGLAISQRLCEAMGGRMWAESPGLGMGSTFHFCVKCVSLPGADRPGTPALPQVPGGVRANPEDAEREAEARRRVRASGAAKVMSLVRTPSQMTFDAICQGRCLRVLLYDESQMVRQTLATSASKVLSRFRASILSAVGQAAG